MDADTILRLKPALTRYMHEFDGCFGRSQTRGHLVTYVQGQLSDLTRKCVEPIADAADMPPRTLQEFLSLSRWDELAMRDRLQQRVARRHHHPHSVGIFDETSFVKKGDKTACVQRQHCGAVGKIENCVVSVHLGYATPDFHTLLDGELYLPEKAWHEDRRRCREAGIAEEITYRPKWRIALDQYRRALNNGVRFAWLTFDEGYGSKPPFLREIDAMGQDYVAEVPASFHVWTSAPAVLHRAHARDCVNGKHGRARRYPRLKAKHYPTVPVKNVATYSPLMRKQPWVKYHVKDGSKGPMVWEVKHLLVYLKDELGLPTRAHHLLVARNVLDHDEVKFFISNATQTTPVETLLLVAFSRWKIERMFQDSKMKLGLDQFEVRKFGSISRHLILSCVSHLFLAEFHQQHARAGPGKKILRPDDQPDNHGDFEAGWSMANRRPLLSQTSGTDQCAIDQNATSQRQGRPQPSQANNPAFTGDWRHVKRPTQMSLASLVAL